MPRQKIENPRIQTTMRIEADLLKRLDVVAAMNGRTRSNFIETEMWLVVKREEKKAKDRRAAKAKAKNDVLG